jgi:diadenosine tetraphosphate (Ap4A) HIT family hydrolase
VISKRHVSDYFALSYNEKRDVESLLSLLRRQILLDDPTVQGFNIGMNCGEAAGQTVMHAHIHLIPRRVGDVDEPRGGVRGCVPGKMGY